MKKARSVFRFYVRSVSVFKKIRIRSSEKLVIWLVSWADGRIQQPPAGAPHSGEPRLILCCSSWTETLLPGTLNSRSSNLFCRVAEPPLFFGRSGWLHIFKIDKASAYRKVTKRKLFIGTVKNDWPPTSCSTILKRFSQCGRLRISNMSERSWIGVT